MKVININIIDLKPVKPREVKQLIQVTFIPESQEDTDEFIKLFLKHAHQEK